MGQFLTMGNALGDVHLLDDGAILDDGQYFAMSNTFDDGQYT